MLELLAAVVVEAAEERLREEAARLRLGQVDARRAAAHVAELRLDRAVAHVVEAEALRRRRS